MAADGVILRTRAGRESDGRAELVRYGRGLRLGLALGTAIGFLVLGLSTVIVPAVHLFSTWAIPLLGLVIALWLLRLRARVDGVRGPCPACGAELVHGALGAVGDEALWIACPSCRAPIEIVLRSAP